jgi:hypothetical protein
LLLLSLTWVSHLNQLRPHLCNLSHQLLALRLDRPKNRSLIFPAHHPSQRGQNVLELGTLVESRVAVSIHAGDLFGAGLPHLLPWIGVIFTSTAAKQPLARLGGCGQQIGDSFKVG